MNYELKEIEIDKIELDINNPRIARAVEYHGKNISAEAIALALSDPSDSDTAGTTLSTLRESIKANGGIINPIVVNKHDGKYTVVEGNTRVQIYKEFYKKGTKGKWDKIIAIVYENMDDYTIHSIRLQSHLVGPRAWNPYSKAKYLKKLSDEDALSLNQIVDLCGGKKQEIVALINAYNDMEEYYHNIVDDQLFDPNNFSAFRELNESKKRIDALTANGFTKKDFGKWVMDNKIDRAEAVRRLPEVLNNEETRKILLSCGIKKAVEALPSKTSSNVNLTIDQLADILSSKIANLQWSEMREMIADKDSKKVISLMDLNENLTEILKQIMREENE